MTHDELLAKISYPENTLKGFNYMQALRAVVELHKRFLYSEDDVLYCEEDNQPYPCVTIRAIERELG